MINVNVIPKIDKSKSPTPNSKAVSKVEKFGWNKNIGKKGEYILVDKMDLEISGDYQRHCNGAIDIDGVMTGRDKRKNQILSIARNFSWELFGVLIVVMWKDGSLYVVDGAHRTIASRFRDDISLLPCIVFERPDIEREALLKLDAQLFYDSCKMRRSMDSHDKHRASKVAGHEDALFIESSLKDRGVEIYSSAHSSTQFGAINTLKSLVSKNKELAMRAFDISADNAKHFPVTRNILIGVFYLLQKECLNEKHLSILSSISHDAVNASIKKMHIITGKGGDKTCALGIIDAINAAKPRNVARVSLE